MSAALGPAGAEYTVQALSWTGGHPYLDVVEVSTMARVHLPVDPGHRLAFVVSEGRFCIGRYVFVSAHDVRLAHCPTGAPAAGSNQCERCAAQDEFRSIHQVHHGVFASAALRTYVEQPHWLYVATFADASSKVGTAADVRKRARLDEQGAVRATYLLCAPNGIVVRHFEDAISRTVNLAQQKHRSSKTAALAAPRPPDELTAAHQAQVDAATAALAPLRTELSLEPWDPPCEHHVLFELASEEPLSVYPHSLRSGPHCLTVHAMVGTAALISANDDSNLMVADLGELKGRRITAADVSSPPAVIQRSLF